MGKRLRCGRGMHGIATLCGEDVGTESGMSNRCLGFTELRDVNAEWRSVLDLGVRYLWRKGHYIEYRDGLLFLDKGQVRLTHFTVDGVEKILWYINAGCLFGETPLFDPLADDKGSVHICATDCVVYAFSRSCLEQLGRTRPDLTLNLLSSMARKLRTLSNQASSLYVDDVLVRTCKFLAQRLLPDSDPLTANPGISRQEMASLLGVHRITLYKVLRQQEEQGLFGPFARHAVAILRPEEFFRLVNS